MKGWSVLLLVCLGSAPAFAADVPEPAPADIVTMAEQPVVTEPAPEAPAATAATEPVAVEAPLPAPPDAGSPPAAETAETAPAKFAHNPDPWQGFNRAVFRFNDTLDRYALKPVAKGYKAVAPRPVRTGLTNFFNNLRAPIVVLNDLLQGKVRHAGSDTVRFIVNTTAGIAGFVDVGSRVGLARHDEDFGQTLGVWGVPSGPYLVLPLLGPSSARDGLGRGVDTYAHPRTHNLDTDINLAITVVDGVNTRASLLDAEEIIQGDRYLFIRDLYLQHREFAINDGRVEEDPFLDDDSFEDEPDAAGPVPEAPADEAPAPAAPESAPAPAGSNF
jgi:phospholipid-binding lipoprotein MlaA